MRKLWIKSLPALFVAVLSLSYATAADEKNLLKPANKPESWRLEQHEGGKAKLTVDGDAACFEITDTGSEAWHVQGTLPAVELAEGKEYTLSFQAKADKERQIQVNAMIDVDDWHTIGLSETVDLTKDYKPYSFSFKVDGSNKEGKNRISFLLAQDKGKVCIKELKLVATG